MRSDNYHAVQEISSGIEANLYTFDSAVPMVTVGITLGTPAA